jgi:hypothetical protein
MGRIILHNRQDEASRAFVASLAEGDHTIIEWYTDAQAVATYMADIGIYPGAFPSVVIRVPDVLMPATPETANEPAMPEHIVPAHWELVRCPASLAEVQAAEVAAAARGEVAAV